MKTRRALCLAFAVASLGAAGCQSWETADSSSMPHVGLALEPSHTEVVAGDTVTITARNKDTYGRDAKLEWNTTAGELETEQNGRIARVQFDEPGTYNVTAVLFVDGEEAVRDTVEIRVRPLT